MSSFVSNKYRVTLKAGGNQALKFLKEMQSKIPYMCI